MARTEKGLPPDGWFEVAQTTSKGTRRQSTDEGEGKGDEGREGTRAPGKLYSIYTWMLLEGISLRNVILTVI